jgi:hypothetical protein
MVIELFQLPFDTPPRSNGNRNFSITKRGVSMCYHFGKIKKIQLSPSFLVDQKISISIKWCGCVGYQPKTFNRHPMVWVVGWQPKLFSHRLMMGVHVLPPF